MQEEIENKSVQLAIQSGKVTAKTIVRGLQAWYRHHQNHRRITANRPAKDPVKGRQSVKQLIGQGQGISSLEIGDSGIRDFKRTARKFGADFAIVKDKSEDPPKFNVFFKARDADAIKQILKEYAKKQLLKKEQKEKGKEKPSIRKKLKEFKEKLAAMPRRDKEKKKERER